MLRSPLRVQNLRALFSRSPGACLAAAGSSPPSRREDALSRYQPRLTEELTATTTEQLKAARIALDILFDDGQLTSFLFSSALNKMLFTVRVKSNFCRK
ncbi:hypothetical protein [Xanthobacter autotrophicus]|uniref:hypothetical protein n=1 Tax=Xanthobacter autotrophicus TaxID=280 RepID=UPI0037295B33